MGKSDPYILSKYTKIVEKKEWNSIAYFGFPNSNHFTDWFDSENKHFYDLSLCNWNINVYPYQKDSKYDLIVCTRVAYFCQDPEKMLKEFNDMLKPGGKILIDWGLGDHWRFKDYKVGWKNEKEHEYAYEKDNFLWSTVWHKTFVKNKQLMTFVENIKKFGYNRDIKDIIDDEVPVVVDIEKMLPKEGSFGIKYDILTLWEDLPQVYFILLIEKLEI